MTEPRHTEIEASTAKPWSSSRPGGPLSGRARRPRIVDEERRLLREVEATFVGADVKRADVDAFGHLPWDAEPGDDEAKPSRLFRE